MGLAVCDCCHGLVSEDCLTGESFIVCVSCGTSDGQWLPRFVIMEAESQGTVTPNEFTVGDLPEAEEVEVSE